MKLTYTDKLHNNTKDSVLENERNDKLPNCKVNRKGQLIKKCAFTIKRRQYSRKNTVHCCALVCARPKAYKTFQCYR